MSGLREVKGVEPISEAERMVLEFARSGMSAAQVTADPVRGGRLEPGRIVTVRQLLYRQIRRHGLRGIGLSVRGGSLYLVRRGKRKGRA